MLTSRLRSSPLLSSLSSRWVGSPPSQLIRHCGVCRLATSSSSSSSSSTPQSHAPPVSITSRSTDYSQWFQDVIAAGELVDSVSAVRGCVTLRPNGFAVWEGIQRELDARIKATGHSNVYFPTLVPVSFLEREAAHVDGFAKETAVVTHHRLTATTTTTEAPDGGDGTTTTTELVPDPDSELAEPLVLRPTSEAMVWDAFKRWIHSHRDLPQLLNQWANVFRWEMRTRPFLRTSEFLWQEGHTAHATRDEALDEAHTMLEQYRQLCEDVLAVPVVTGEKSAGERFAGADATFTIEAMMANGWALQSGTSHFLGQNFAKAFDVTYQTEDGDREHVWATSWGVSTRLIGALIMSHSDDTGLVLPPNIAPTQVVVMAVGPPDDTVGATVAKVVDNLKTAGVRAVSDTRPMRPGKRFFEWERKGVPLRIEIGPRDVAAGQAQARSRLEGSSRQTLELGGDGLVTCVQDQLAGIQTQLFQTAQDRLDRRTVQVTQYSDMVEALGQGGGDDGAAAASPHKLDGPAFFLAPWADDDANEAAIQADCKATIRCYPFSQQDSELKALPCFYSGRPATHVALFARAY